MADHFLAAALGSARRLLVQASDPAADFHLLDRFVRDHDESAFNELVARHGPLVWAACRRGANNAADAEDAFQATFLVLAQRAGRVRHAPAVGGWLFRVAVRLTARTRARVARPGGPARPEADPSPGPVDRAAWQDLVAVLDSEMAALPDTVRAALVCCYYEGLTQDEAAERLGWKVRTVRARVARGRSILQARLARRGIDLGAALAAVAVGVDAASGLPSVSCALLGSGSMTASSAVASLVREGLAMTGFVTSQRLALAAAALVVVGGIGYAIVMRPWNVPDAGPSAVVETVNGNPQPATDPKKFVDAATVYDRAIDGCVYIVSDVNGTIIEGTGVLIDGERRLVLTTNRVVGDSDLVSVQFPYHNLDGGIETDRQEYTRSATAKLTPMGRVIYRDQTRDLALVQLDRLGRSAHALEIGDDDAYETALHIGSGTGTPFPMAVRKVLTSPNSNGETFKAKTIALSGVTDDSGGPLVDRNSRLVGIVLGASGDAEDRNAILAVGVAEIRAFLADKDKPPRAPSVVVDPKKPQTPVIPFPEDFVPSVKFFPGDSSADTVEIYKKCVDSVVFTIVPVRGGHAEASGILIDAEKRYVLTSYHAVEDEQFVYCQFPVYQKDGSLMTDKKKYIERVPAGQAPKGKVLYRDKTRDLALIQLDKLPPTARAINLAPKSTSVGETTWTIGSPGAVTQIFHFNGGKVRAVGMDEFVVGLGGEPLRIRCKMVTTTNPASPGDSGGPLVNKEGELVGVTETYSKAALSVCQFVDIEEVRAFLKEKKIAINGPVEQLAVPPGRPKSNDAPPTKGSGDTPKTDTPSIEGGTNAEDEKAAIQLLQRARLFKDGDDNLPIYRRKLKEVISKYPTTKAAMEAAKILGMLK